MESKISSKRVFTGGHFAISQGIRGLIATKLIPEKLHTIEFTGSEENRTYRKVAFGSSFHRKRLQSGAYVSIVDQTHRSMDKQTTFRNSPHKKRLGRRR